LCCAELVGYLHRHHPDLLRFTYRHVANSLRRVACAHHDGLPCDPLRVAQIITASLATPFGWTRALDFAALLTALAAFLWIFVNADENLEDIPVQSDAAQDAGGQDANRRWKYSK